MSKRKFDHPSRWTEVRYIDGKYSLYRCQCGTERSVNRYHVENGMSASCGCLRREVTAERRLKHGMTDTKEYRAWCHMKDRCYNPNTIYADRWMGRGIIVCERWLESFENFFSDMGKCPTGKSSIDRINVDGNYEPGNCRWATAIEQGNNMTNNVHMVVRGRTLTVAEAAREAGLKYATVYRRYVVKGESAEEALRAI